MMSLNSTSFSAMMQVIGLVTIAIFCVRNIILANINIMTNSIKLAIVFIGFLTTSVYAFLMSMRKAK